MAHFMPSHTESFERENKIPDISNSKTSSKPAIKKENDVLQAAKDLTEEKNTFPFITETQKLEPYAYKIPQLSRNLLMKNKKSGFKKENDLNVSQHFEPEKRRKKIIKNPFFNDGVKIASVFLLIAIGLAFLNLGELSLLFGIVSIIFFIIGLKKYMRRKRLKRILKI
jgi:hypothetical protein